MNDIQQNLLPAFHTLVHAAQLADILLPVLRQHLEIETDLLRKDAIACLIRQIDLLIERADVSRHGVGFADNPTVRETVDFVVENFPGQQTHDEDGHVSRDVTLHALTVMAHVVMDAAEHVQAGMSMNPEDLN